MGRDCGKGGDPGREGRETIVIGDDLTYSQVDSMRVYANARGECVSVNYMLHSSGGVFTSRNIHGTPVPATCMQVRRSFIAAIVTAPRPVTRRRSLCINPMCVRTRTCLGVRACACTGRVRDVRQC